MAPWACAISGCEASFDDLETLLSHQVSEHERHQCKVCDEIVPEGFFAIRHAFSEHTRAEYVRHYGANSDAIRERESLIELVENTVDLEAVINRLESTGADGAPAEAVK